MARSWPTAACLFPANVNSNFSPCPIWRKYPQYCDRFNDGDILLRRDRTAQRRDRRNQGDHARIKGLQKVRLNCCSNLNDDCLGHLGKIPTIKELYIDDSGISGKGHRQIASIKMHLQELRLCRRHGCQPVFLERPGRLHGLKHLSLQAVDLTREADFKNIASLSKISRRLNLKDSQISSDSTGSISHFAPIWRQLSIQGSRRDTVAKRLAFCKLSRPCVNCTYYTKAMTGYVKAQFSHGLPQVEVE